MIKRNHRKRASASENYEIAALNVRFYTNREGALGKIEAIDPHRIAEIPMAAFTEYPMLHPDEIAFIQQLEKILHP